MASHLNGSLSSGVGSRVPFFFTLCAVVFVAVLVTTAIFELQGRYYWTPTSYVEDKTTVAPTDTQSPKTEFELSPVEGSDVVTEEKAAMDPHRDEAVTAVKKTKRSRRATKPQREVHPYSDGWANTVAMCSLMKDEQIPDIVEWVEYHRWLGVDKIFLRENGKAVTPEIEAALQPHVEEGYLDFGAWEGQSPRAQQLWYNRCARSNLAGAYSWILFGDMDEFMVLLKDGKAMKEPDLKGYLEKRRGAAGLSLQWVLFGSSGHRDRPKPGGPLRHFSQCSNELSFQMKCLAASYHMCKTPFVGPLILHACAYKYEEGEFEALVPPVLFGDGNPVPRKMVTVNPAFAGPGRRRLHSHSHDGAAEGVSPSHSRRLAARGSAKSYKCRSYEGHLKGHLYNKNTRSIPKGETLVLFHYVTRSFQDFAENKLSRYAGRYAEDFRERREAAIKSKGKTPSDWDLMDEFEEEQGFNKKAPVCRSAVEAKYGTRCCGDSDGILGL